MASMTKSDGANMEGPTELREASPLIMTSHELIYILGLDETEAAKTNYSLLTLPDDPNSAMGAMGAATLFARGLASVDGETLALGSEVALVGYVLTQATRWVEVGIATNGTLDAMIGFEFRSVSVILRPMILGTFEVSLTGADEELEAIAEQAAKLFISTHVPSMIVVYSGDEGAVRSMAAVRELGDVWRSVTDIKRPFDSVDALSEDLLLSSTEDIACRLLSTTLRR